MAEESAQAKRVEDHYAKRRQYDAAYRAEHKEGARKRKRSYVDRLRDQAYTLLGNRCARCGLEDRRVFEIRRGEGKGGKTIVDRLKYVIRVNGEGCTLLCANCYHIVEWESRNPG